MVADFFTKPLQGGMFSVYRKAIMGHDMGDLIDNHIKTQNKIENVGKYGITF